jgi:uncharacterized delta-60 repeat protein
VKRVLILSLVVALIACQQFSPAPESTQSPRALGVVEVRFDPETRTATARLQPQGVLDPQNAIAFTPTTFSLGSDGSNRFLSAAFSLTNNTGSAIDDLTLVALHRAGNRADTALRNLQDFSGGAVNLDAYARAVRPAHGMDIGTPPSVSHEHADLQLFKEAEVAALQGQAVGLLGSGEYLFAYGYVARASTTSRQIAASVAGVSTGTITVAVRVPDSNEPSANAYRFSMTFLAFAQPVPSRVSESVEEQPRAYSGRVETRAAPDGSGLNASQIATVSGGFNLARSDKLFPVCRVRTAGSAGNPLAHLGPDPLPSSPGSLDVCFGSSGKRSVVAAQPFVYGEDVIVQPDGRIVVVSGAPGDIELFRFLSNGQFDPSFGVGGKVVTDLGGYELPDVVALDANGKVLVAGLTSDGSSNSEFLVVRYEADGRLDTGFGINGAVRTAPFGLSGPGNARAISVRPNGKIVVGGTVTFQRVDGSVYASSAVVQYLPNGDLDTAFGESGFARTYQGDFQGNAPNDNMVLQADGKIVLTGVTTQRIPATGEVTTALTVLRLDANGTPDASFGNDGFVSLPNVNRLDGGNAVTVQSDGKIVAAGYSAFVRPDSFLEYTLLTARFNANGTPDLGFGTGGAVSTDLGAGAEQVSAVEIQSDGRIVVSSRFAAVGGALVRYLPNGSLDTTFGASGIVVDADEFNPYDIRGLALQADDRIVSVGRGDLYDLFLSRRNP